MNRRPLRAAYLGAALATLILIMPAGAWAHVDVQPRLVEQGEVAELRIELPQLRAGPGPERLEVEGEGIEVLSTRLQGVVGPETVWSVRVHASGPPGPALLILRAVYADGESVEVDDTLTVVPPAEVGSSVPWVAIVAGVLLALALAGAALFLARRKAW